MLYLVLFSILFVHNALSFRIGSRVGCTISVNGDLGEPQPLLLKPNRTNYDAFYFPVDFNGTINFNKNQIIELACPGGNIKLNGRNSSSSIARATCVSDDTFEINAKNYAFKQITCTTNTYHTARYTGKTCESKYKEIEIGFDLGSQFLHHITVCFDPIKQSTLYTVFNMTSAIGGYQANYPRPTFIEGPFYDVGKLTVNELYVRKPQRSTINELVGLPANSTKYIKDDNYYFLSRGHLTAKSDFVFGAQHRLTFYYVNIAPQWQTFNGGNWNTLEQDVRRYASTRKLDLLIYTGIYGVTTLPHEITGKDVELYLYTKENNKYAIPVPMLYWKVVYNQKTKAGTVFLGVNNPYHNDVSKSLICEDVSKKIDWLLWNQTSIYLGYSYACTVDSFRKVVPYLPNFEVKSLLV